MLSDRPIQDDLEDELGFKPYADALAELIDSLGTDWSFALQAPVAAQAACTCRISGRVSSLA
jgi:hypothetical protein